MLLKPGQPESIGGCTVALVAVNPDGSVELMIAPVTATPSPPIARPSVRDEDDPIDAKIRVAEERLKAIWSETTAGELNAVGQTPFAGLG